MLGFWTREFETDGSAQSDPGLTRTALNLLEELARPDSTDVLLATDLHAGNVLRAEREPWLVIDPKPFVGDPSYDATQHLLNCRARLTSDPEDTIRRFADLLELSAERIGFGRSFAPSFSPSFSVMRTHLREP
jgi:streptomycin 6-kinase